MSIFKKIFMLLSVVLVVYSILNINTNIYNSDFKTVYRDTDPDSDYYTLIDKKVSNNSFQFLLHLNHFKQFSQDSHFSNKKGEFAEYMMFEVFLISRNTIQFKFKDHNKTEFELPCQIPFPCHEYPSNMTEPNRSNLDYDYFITIKESPFSFTLSRKTTREVLFTTLNNFVKLQQNYVELSTDLPSENLFGLGERTTNFKLKSGIYTLYNKDLYGELEDGSGVGKNRYGSHPMYLMRERSGNYHVSYLRNSYPLDVEVDHLSSKLTYKISGGVLDFTFFIGDKNPETSIKMYHKYLGGYSMPPFWSLGFHQSRWGYLSVNMIEDVLDNYEKLKLPLDTIWTDIDYMQDHMPFTLNNNFNPIEFKKMLDKYAKKYVMIMEPAMGIKWPTYEYYTRGKDLGIFIKNSVGDDLINTVWPGRCHFIDYFNPKAHEYWEDALGKFHDKINFSGVWLDMNEIAAFKPGQLNFQGDTISCRDDTKYSYVPGQKPLETATICPNALHYNNMKHVQIHNYYPNMQSKVTYDFLEKLFPNKFPFILSRANAPGLGKYAAHWSGDNYGRFSFYKLSIAEVLNHNLFGVPMVGADICGFGEDTPEKLCAKWYQMGSLYPFSRSHAHIDSYRKEPFAMGSTLLETTKKSLQFRYSILKYYYSLFMLNKGTGTIIRPLFYEFYKDTTCLENSIIDNFFMIGSALLVVPNLHDDDSSTLTSAYFPEGNWFDLRDYTKVNKQGLSSEFINVQTTLNEMPAVFLHSGKSIYTNDITNVLNSYQLGNIFKFVIAVNENSTSEGIIPALNDYDSKSEVTNCIEKNCHIKVLTTVKGSLLSITFKKADHYDPNFNSLKIKSFVILGVKVNTAVSSNKTHATEYVNENCFIIHLMNNLEIQKEDLTFEYTISTR
jgi:alpha-glucosidase (family GH31 glycosyl hydrolase)